MIFKTLLLCFGVTLVSTCAGTTNVSVASNDDNSYTIANMLTGYYLIPPDSNGVQIALPCSNPMASKYLPDLIRKKNLFIGSCSVSISGNNNVGYTWSVSWNGAPEGIPSEMSCSCTSNITTCKSSPTGQECWYTKSFENSKTAPSVTPFYPCFADDGPAPVAGSYCLIGGSQICPSGTSVSFPTQTYDSLDKALDAYLGCYYLGPCSNN